MKLWYTPQSPFARKVRIAAMELGFADKIDLQFIAVAPSQPNPDYARTRHPLRKVPVLELEDGTILYDSTVICEYLDAAAGGDRLIPNDPGRRWQVLTNHALAQGMCEAAVLLRYETWLRPEALRWQPWIDDQWEKVENGLAWFEAHPAALNGPLDLAQISLGCLLGYLDFRWPEHGWRANHASLKDWFEELEARPSFQATKPTQAPPQ
jgi:glutathione S-transferase